MYTNIEYYEHGDFLMTNNRMAFVFDRKGKNGEAHHLFCVDMDQRIDSSLQKCGTGEQYCDYLKNAVLADNEATEAIIKGLKKLGKYWNENKKRIENIGVYKEGDFLKTFRNSLFILKKIDMFEVYDHVFLVDNSLIPGESRCCYIEDIAGYCTPKEEIRIIDALKKAGKRWNAETKCVENIPIYKNGDFLRTKMGNLFIFKRFKRVRDEKEDSAFCHFFTSVSLDYKGYGLNKNGVCFEKDIDRYCTPEEKQKILDDLAKDGKRWNAEKKCIEDIPKRKFKAGDKVKIKDGISSETHRFVVPHFTYIMDEFIGKKLTVKEYNSRGFVITDADYFGYEFSEDWLELWNDKSDYMFKKGDRVIFSKDFSERMRSENSYFGNHVKKYIGKPLTVSKVCNNGCVWIEGEELHGFNKEWLELWSDEPKNGDLAIFWDNDKDDAIIRLYDKKDRRYHYDSYGMHWDNAIKFESKEQFEKIRKG